MQLQHISTKIYEIRGQQVMLDFDLAELYRVETKRLKEAVRRNSDRFPEDFMFEITINEYNSLRSQIATLKKGRGQHSKFSPFAFTEQGVAMLASVLNSATAIQTNIQIVRAFVLIRKFALFHKELTDQLKELEARYNQHFKTAFEAIDYLMNKDQQQIDQANRTRIGFKKQN